MDNLDADPEELRRSLAFLRRINRWLGYTESIMRCLDRFSRNWRTGETIRMIDLGTGSADVPRAILQWADRRGLDVRVVGVDRHPVTALTAAEQADPRLHIVQADVANLPFEPGSFDYALASMFLHHLDDEQVVATLATMDRLARRGVVVADLMRHPRAYRWIKLFSAFSTPMVRHDGPASVAQAFTREELVELARRAGIHYASDSVHFGYRLLLAGEKPSAVACTPAGPTNSDGQRTNAG